MRDKTLPRPQVLRTVSESAAPAPRGCCAGVFSPQHGEPAELTARPQPPVGRKGHDDSANSGGGNGGLLRRAPTRQQQPWPATGTVSVLDIIELRSLGACECRAQWLLASLANERARAAMRGWRHHTGSGTAELRFTCWRRDHSRRTVRARYDGANSGRGRCGPPPAPIQRDRVAPHSTPTTASTLAAARKDQFSCRPLRLDPS